MKQFNFSGRALTMLLGLSMAALAQTNNRSVGDSKLVARVPFPGYPEGIVVTDNTAWVSGPAAFGVPGNAQASPIFGFDLKTGSLVRTITLQNQPQAALKALSCIAADDDKPECAG
jgi:hypothetical protein